MVITVIVFLEGDGAFPSQPASAENGTEGQRSRDDL